MLLAFALGALTATAAILLGVQVGYRLALRAAPAGAVADVAQAVAAAPVVAAQTLRPHRAVTVTEEDEYAEEHGRQVAEALRARAAAELGNLTADDQHATATLPVGGSE